MLETCRHLEKDGFKVTYVPVTPEGVIKVDELAAAITNETILITTMHVNNEIGTIQPIAEIGKIAKEKGVKFHTDAVQAMGKVKVDVNDLGVDLLSLSGHKIHGPKGIGVLYVRKGTPVRSLVYGGGHERGIRSGTENVPGIVGMGKACEIMTRDFDRNVAHMTRLRDQFNGRLNEDRAQPAERAPGRATIAEQREHQLQLHRGRIDGAAARHAGHRGVYRLRLLVQESRAVARVIVLRPARGRGPRLAAHDQ